MHSTATAEAAYRRRRDALRACFQAEELPHAEVQHVAAEPPDGPEPMAWVAPAGEAALHAAAVPLRAAIPYAVPPGARALLCAA